jgi:pyruvate,orthophosphate dikinase
MAHQWAYFFGDCPKPSKALLGGKGLGLFEMTAIGLPVPPGFTITTEACNEFQKTGQWPALLHEQVTKLIAHLEKATAKTFGSTEKPLFVSVRSGAKDSMPGMMDTVLNVGMNPETMEAQAKLSGSRRFALDSYRRFIQMFGDVVMEVKHELFEHELSAVKNAKGIKFDVDMDEKDLETVIANYLTLYERETKKKFPTDPQEQLSACISAVFKSWNNNRAVAYRNLNKIPHDGGTAVTVQSMVFGNMGATSATGVGFTRDPSTGENVRYGEYLTNAQGEDVVAGIRTPKKLVEMAVEMPNSHKELMAVFAKLEAHYKDMQDMEFTIENGKLYMLQTRSAKRTAACALRCAVEMCKEGVIDKETAIMRVTPAQIDVLLHKQLDPKVIATLKPDGKGLPASPGGAVGIVVFRPDEAQRLAKEKKKVVLVRTDTSPEDIMGMAVSQGILTARGGMTSHAAVVARGMNVACVSGCGALLIDEHTDTARLGDKVIKAGDFIALDGATGCIYLVNVPVVDPDLGGFFGEFLSWCDSVAKLHVFSNCDHRKDATNAKNFGAVGIGLVRTEHMFFAKDRILAMREMILASDVKSREKALEKVLPYQISDFKDLMEVMDGKPVVIRLLDPPLHEFLPKEEKEQIEVADKLGIKLKDVQDKIAQLAESNPMLGFRGCRLGVVYPEINIMQCRAVFLAALELKKAGMHPRPYIEVPLVGITLEYLPLKGQVEKLAEELGAKGVIDYKVGTMIEVPRAALTADEFAPIVDFMSFGTNDLTQMTCGLSRDDAGKFLPIYVEKGIYKRDPFQAIEQGGVGKLMKMCVDLARKANPKITIGICGEQGGEPESIHFCHKIGLDDISMSPFRVPVARLAAGQAAVLAKQGKL